MTDEDHFTAAYCNPHMLIHTREMIRMGFFRPNWTTCRTTFRKGERPWHDGPATIRGGTRR